MELIQLAEQSIATVQSASRNKNACVTPPAVTEAMELNEWAVSITLLEVVKPRKKLLQLLDASSPPDEWQSVIITNTLNKSLLRLSQEHLSEKTTRKAPVSVQTGTDAGVVQVLGELTPDKQLCKCVVGFYYHALESVLYSEQQRWNADDSVKGGKKAEETAMRLQQLILNPLFHAALLACCTACVTKAIGCTQKLHPSQYLRHQQVYSILHVADTTPFQFLKVSETFVRALTTMTASGGSAPLLGLPRVLQRHMQQTEINVLDSLLWCRNGAGESLPDRIEEFMEETLKSTDRIRLWPPAVLAPSMPIELADSPTNSRATVHYPGPMHENYVEIQSISYILRKLLNLAHGRIQALCQRLDIPPAHPVTVQVWITFRYLIRHRLELLYDRHLDHWILCCLYGVTRTVKYEPELKFSAIIDAYIAIRSPELGAVTCQRIVRNIKISNGKPAESSSSMGNVIELYNKVFVPAMKEHLLLSKSLKRCSLELGKLLMASSTETGSLAEAEVAPGVHVKTATSRVVVPSSGPTASIQMGMIDPGAVEYANEFSTTPAGVRR